MTERRRSQRRDIGFYFNKYIGGYPHLCRALDVSSKGIQAIAINEPETRMEAFPIERRLPGDSHTFWLWGRRVRSHGRRQAIEFLNLSVEDAHRLERYMTAA
jgi:hypothetical protein